MYVSQALKRATSDYPFFVRSNADKNMNWITNLTHRA